LSGVAFPEWRIVLSRSICSVCICAALQVPVSMAQSINMTSNNTVPAARCAYELFAKTFRTCASQPYSGRIHLAALADAQCALSGAGALARTGQSCGTQWHQVTSTRPSGAPQKLPRDEPADAVLPLFDCTTTLCLSFCKQVFVCRAPSVPATANVTRLAAATTEKVCLRAAAQMLKEH